MELDRNLIQADVAVIGGGNATLCAAMTTRETGASVVLIESAPKAVVIACGGFQANIKWLKEYWGESANNFIVRECPYDNGRMLRVLLEQDARPVGDPRRCHAIAVDARAINLFMPSDKALKEAERVMVFCNAGRYCKGFCAVFYRRSLAVACSSISQRRVSMTTP